MKTQTITERIYAIIFDLLERNPDGLQWAELLRQINKADPTLHPKTVNGCTWRLLKKFPDEVHKPQKGLFQLKKYKSNSNHQ